MSISPKNRTCALATSPSGLGYQLFLGGSLDGTGRLALLVHHGIPEEHIAETVLAVLAFYDREHRPHESFSAYINRISQETCEERITTFCNGNVKI